MVILVSFGSHFIFSPLRTQANMLTANTLLNGFLSLSQRCNKLTVFICGEMCIDTIDLSYWLFA